MIELDLHRPLGCVPEFLVDIGVYVLDDLPGTGVLTEFTQRGAHARSAVGVGELPLDAPVEVELIVEVG
ncbi:hypothetical protein A9W94_26465 [Mycobacterium asiaticum]|nr:hypothetical protein A9W94_26465 [Mycobacterium asiaticum]